MRKHELWTLSSFIILLIVSSLVIFLHPSTENMSSVESIFVSIFSGIIVALPSLIIILFDSYANTSNEVYNVICELNKYVVSFSKESGIYTLPSDICNRLNEYRRTLYKLDKNVFFKRQGAVSEIIDSIDALVKKISKDSETAADGAKKFADNEELFSKLCKLVDKTLKQ